MLCDEDGKSLTTLSSTFRALCFSVTYKLHDILRQHGRKSGRPKRLCKVGYGLKF